MWRKKNQERSRRNTKEAKSGADRKKRADEKMTEGKIKINAKAEWKIRKKKGNLWRQRLRGGRIMKIKKKGELDSIGGCVATGEGHGSTNGQAAAGTWG